MKSQLTLTFTANPSMISQLAYIYADKNTTTTISNAIVKVVATLSQVNPQTITINVSQLGYRTLGNTGMRPIMQDGTINAAGDYVLVMENLEEAAMNLTPSAAQGTEGITNMQWGYNKTAIQTAALGTQTYFMRNGYENTLLSIYNNRCIYIWLVSCCARSLCRL